MHGWAGARGWYFVIGERASTYVKKLSGLSNPLWIVLAGVVADQRQLLSFTHL
jgi:hypothetical protein